MDIRQLKYFVAIADYGSLSQAAFKLHVVQSALSHNLAQLEEELGTQLFYRQPRGVEVTQAGKMLYEYANTVLETISLAKENISSVSTAVREQVWIGLNHTANHLLLPSLPKTLMQQYPDIKLGLVEDLSATLIEYLVDGKVDIVVAYNPPEDASLVSQAVFRERLCFVGSSKLLKKDHSAISLQEVMDFPLILAGQRANLRGIVNDDKLIKQLESACFMEINSLSALISVLKEDMGCSILSAATVQDEIDQGNLIARPIIEPEINRELHIVYLKNSVHATLLEKLADTVKKHILMRMKAKNVAGTKVER